MTMKKLGGVSVPAGKNGAAVAVYFHGGAMKVGARGKVFHVDKMARNLPAGVRRRLRKTLAANGLRHLALASVGNP